MRWFVVACLVLAACGDDEKTEETEEPFAPTEGAWTRVDGDVTEDTCGMDDGDTDGDQPVVLTLTDHGDGTLSVVNEEDVTWTCTLPNMDFVCDAQVTQSTDVPNLDAVVEAAATPSGSFSSEEEMSGQTSVELTCEGEECATVEERQEVTFPCTMVQAWTASAGAPQ